MSDLHLSEPLIDRCRACDGPSRARKLKLKELMFQTGEEFWYFECADCGTVQICDVPADLGRHYGPEYYSFRPTLGGVRKVLKSAALRDLGGGLSPVGRLLNRLNRSPVDALWLKACGVQLGTRILDVGCGSGERLRDLDRAGYSNLAGVNPFVPQDIRLSPRVTIRKAELSEIAGCFDLVMFHHSLST